MLQQLLRDDMGFQGLICSDSLLMAGARERFDREEEMALAVLNAGVDLLLDLEEPLKVVDYLCECVKAGRLKVERSTRLSVVYGSLKSGCLPRRKVNLQRIRNVRRIERIAGHASRTRARSPLSVKRIERPPCPSEPDVPVVAILLKPFETAIEPPEQPLGPVLRERFRRSALFSAGTEGERGCLRNGSRGGASARQLLVAIIVRPAAWHAFGLREQQVAFVRELVGGRDDAVLACLGVPSALEPFSAAAVRICTYSDVPVSQRALVEFLLGECGGR